MYDIWPQKTNEADLVLSFEFGTSYTFPRLLRSIDQKIREYDVLDKRKTVTALRAGEDRAILLGTGMVLGSIMMYFVLGVTILRSYSDRYYLSAIQ